MENFDLLSSLTSILIKISVSYVLLGLFTLILVEAISSVLQLRSKFLYRSLKKSFNDDNLLACIYNHPLISILGENQSYIDRAIFSYALIDCLHITDPVVFIKSATQQESQYYKNNFVQGLCVLSRSASSVEAIRQKASFLFNDFVHKISNGYKRIIQEMLLLVATLIVISLNIDSIKIFNAISTNTLIESVIKTIQEDKLLPDATKKILSHLSQDAIPIGWPANFHITSFTDLLSMLAGWLITIFFTCFTAQFLYSRYINVRTPETAKGKKEV